MNNGRSRFQEAFEAGGDYLAGFFCGEEAFEDA